MSAPSSGARSAVKKYEIQGDPARGEVGILMYHVSPATGTRISELILKETTGCFITIVSPDTGFSCREK
jgi:hypothetical protein